ncbi:MAG: biotin transporter BioY [Solirubrobacterales bacterium]
MSTFTEAASAARVPVLADVFASSRVRTALTVLGGALFTALLAQITIPMTPVPMTGQTLAVVLVGSALGWKRGMAALALYVVLGFFLPFYADGSSGAENVLQVGSIAGATAGYLIGFIFAAGVVGWFAEHGSDRKFVSAFLSFVIGQLVIFAFGLAGLKLAAPELVEAGFMASSNWSTVIHDGFTIFIVGGLVKAAVGALLMPAAWKILESSKKAEG